MPILHNSTPDSPDLQRILHIEVPVIVKLADRRLPLSEVLKLSAGSIVEFSKSMDQPLELLVNNKPIALGRAVQRGDKIALQITHIGDVKELIASLKAD